MEGSAPGTGLSCGLGRALIDLGDRNFSVDFLLQSYGRQIDRIGPDRRSGQDGRRRRAMACWSSRYLLLSAIASPANSNAAEKHENKPVFHGVPTPSH